MSNQSLLFLLLIVPLIGSVVSFCAPKKISGFVATSACFLSFLIGLKLYPQIESDGGLVTEIFPWISVGDISIPFSLTLDPLSMVMTLLVTGVGSLIHLYSIGYMDHDPSKRRYFAYLNLFIFSMLTLVLGSNLAVLFIGWEGVGLCSYLLIGFWFKNPNFTKAGQKAFIVNRIGDLGVLLAMFLLLKNLGTLEFSALQSLFTRGAPLGEELLFIISLALFFGATGKSAQLPLFVWLPDAMAGPTPVSALIHAATMVTAGIYLMARSYFLFDASPEVLALVVMIGIATAVIAATAAIAQKDLKRVLAYSTISQLGFMFVAAGCGAYWVALFHVLTHAFFKACLFLSAGSVIHACDNEQDMSKMGGLWSSMKVTGSCYLISVLAIAGIFPFAGYFSKHEIIQSLTDVTNPFLAQSSYAFVWLLKAASLLTALYMTRSFMMTFTGKYRGTAHPHEAPILMLLPVMILGFLSLTAGAPLGVFLHDYLSEVLPISAEMPHSGMFEGSLPGILGVVLGFFLYRNYKPIRETNLYKFLSSAWCFDKLYELTFGKLLKFLSNISDVVVNRGIINGAVEGVVSSVVIGGELVRALQAGRTRDYLLYVLASIVVLLSWFVVG